jgi:dTDP-4-dehydrorhamnose 3,5-epimerase
MKFHPTPIEGARLIEPEPRGDDRGFFARLFCEREFSDAGLTPSFVQINDAFSNTKGTLRGMHYQIGDAAEVKIVRCIRGALWDVILDLRADSATFGKWFGAELTQDNRLMMYVPRGVAHGLMTLADNTEAFYLVNNFYSPENERGVRWNDPHFAISWPGPPVEISAKDAAWRDFDPNPKFGVGA